MKKLPPLATFAVIAAAASGADAAPQRAEDRLGSIAADLGVFLREPG